MEMDMDMATWLEDEDPDRRPTTLLGKIRRFFDRGDRSGGWFSHGDGGWFNHGTGWGCGGGDGGGCCGGGGCGGGGCGSC